MIRKLAEALKGAKPVALSIGGLAFLSASAFAVALPLGLAAVGVSFLLIEWRVTS
jgi:hypothetical protein